MKYDLQFPIELDGKTISSVTLRRTKGKDMVVIGDHVATLARFHASNATAIASIAKMTAATEDGGAIPDDINVDGINPPDSNVYRAMVAIAGHLADLGEAAGELDLVDLQEITGLALNPGESQGRGKARNGGGR